MVSRLLGLGLVASAGWSCGSGSMTAPSAVPITITSVAPATGSTFGGTVVTITGDGFDPATGVQFGTTAAPAVTVVSSKVMTALTPVHIAGPVSLLVVSGSRSVLVTDAFTFVIPIVGGNTPPTINNVSITPPKENQPALLATIGDSISLSGDVFDPDTSLNRLEYIWAAAPPLGTFSGDGVSVRWIAPSRVDSPAAVDLILTVIERFLEPDTMGLPVQREHRVQRATTVHVHDSVREIGDMAADFLALFSDSSRTSEQVLHNFSRTCDGGKGYRDEQADIEFNRASRDILSYSLGEPSVSFAYGSRQACGRKDGTAGDACAEVVVAWVDREKPTPQNPGGGSPVEVRGTDFVSAVYEDTRWRLCHSRWTAFETVSGKARLLDIKKQAP